MKMFFFILYQMLTLYKYFIYVFIFLSDTMSDWKSFKSVKYILLSVIVRWPMIICSLVSTCSFSFFIKCLHYINTLSMFLFFSRTQCLTEKVSSRSSTFCCQSLSDDRWLFAALYPLSTSNLVQYQNYSENNHSGNFEKQNKIRYIYCNLIQILNVILVYYQRNYGLVIKFEMIKDLIWLF